MRALFLLALLIPAPLAALGLDGTLAAADEQAAAGEYQKARKTLLAALGEGADRGAVLAAMDGIERRLAAWAFAETAPEPEPGDLLAGEVRSWKEKGYKLRITYDWAGLDPAERSKDFFSAGEMTFFRVPLTGDFKLVLEGDHPADPGEFALLAGFDREGENGWKFTPGYKREKTKPVLLLPRRAERIGAPFELFETEVEGLDEPEGDWIYSIELRRDTFTFKRGSKKLGSWKTEFSDRTDGYIGFLGAGVREVELTVALQPQAWETRRDVLVERHRESFLREEYDVSADLPAWYAEMKAASAAAIPGRPPEGIPEEAARDWAQLLDPDLPMTAADWVEAHPGLEAGPAAFATALRYATFGEWRACAAQVEAARAALPEFGPLLALEARARFHTNERRKAVEELRPHLAAWPDDIGPTLARLSGRLEGPRAMLAALDETLAAGGLSDRVRDARRVLQTALAFPEEPGNQRFSGTAIHLFSDGPQEFTQELGQSSVALIGFLTRYWSQVRTPQEPHFVLHFRGEEGRLDFCRRAGLPEDARGYLPAYRISLVVLDPLTADPAAPVPLFSALWEQFLDTTVDVEVAPRWFVKGFGGIAGGCVNVGAGVELHANRELIRASSQNEAGWFFTPGQLVNLPDAEWDKHVHWAEPEAYLLVRYLWAHAPREQQDQFRAFADTVLHGLTRQEGLAKLFQGVDQAALIDGLKAFREGEIAGL